MALPAIIRESIQEFPNARKGEGETAFWSLVTTRGYSLSAWATRQRERELRNLFLHENNWMGQGAFAGLSKKVAATAWEISGKRNVDYFQRVLREANFQAGWNVFIERVVLDYLRQDGGAYIEVIAPGNPLRPPTGKATGIAHLDSLRCFPTGDPQYPVIYYSRKGTKHLLHASRVIHLVDLSDGDENNPGYGHCALSRAISIVNQQIHMNRFVESKLDDRPAPGFVVASGITEAQKNTAFNAYRANQNNDMRPEEGKIVWFFSLDPSQQIKLEHTTFAQTPDGYSYKEYTELHVNAWALAIGCDVQELWQLTGGSLGSGQQSTILHAKSQGKTFGDLLTKLERSLNDVLPDYLEFQFKRRDSQEEQERATTASAWAGFTTSVAATLSMDEQRRLLASLVEPYKDIVTDENGEVLERDDLDPQAPENEETVDDATPAAAAPTETQEAPRVADAEKAIASGFVYVDLANDPYLVDFQKQLKKVFPEDMKIDWQTPSTFHITLAYCPTVTNTQMLRSAAAVAGDPLPLRGSELGIFENGDERALHILIDKTPALADLQRDIVYGFQSAHAELSPFSLPDTYTPHVTIAYLPQGALLPAIKANFNALCKTVVFGRDEYQPFITLNLAENNSKEITDTRAAFEREFNALLSEARGDDTNRRSFSIRLRDLLRRAGKAAYNDGLQDGGVSDGFDATDSAVYARLLAQQSAYVSGFSETLFADGISDGAADGKAQLWYSKSITPFYHAGLNSADANGMYLWRYGDTDHCDDCLRFNGQRKRLRTWVSSGYVPQASKLKCKGFRCACRLIRQGAIAA